MSEEDGGGGAGNGAAAAPPEPEPYGGGGSSADGGGGSRPNGILHPEPSVADADDDASANQVANMEQADSDDEEAVTVGEDAGKDEFVDAPDELNADAREVAVTAGTEGRSEERSNLHGSDLSMPRAIAFPVSIKDSPKAEIALKTLSMAMASAPLVIK